ncbi:hybrid sensor histidine kinase/response regulator transcription factor [Chitinophaga sp. 22321]|uniref:histidine kinase n=1 Tax=Chitinophaga hostae TaxID=2831022 RepID=A0ABS5IWU8_9BACT|nr:hybrid sensor histidine kinase/response regulator transcription factor [Chitinophaga hostae]MBS0026712.1 response regulator [Chitinophaga hostae]
MLKKTILISLLLSLLLYANAQEFSSLNVNNGLSNNQVNCIFKDSRGFMWFGTMSGLNRYDGFTCRVFRHDASDPASISDDYVMAINAVPGNRLYIRTRNGDVLYDPVTEQFSDAAIWLKSKGLPVTGITCMQQIDGSCWIGYQDGSIYYFNENNNSAAKRLQHHAGIPVADINQTAPNQIGILYLNGELDMADARTGRLLSHSDAVRRLVDNSPISLRFFTDAQQDLWVYMPGSDFGVVYINSKTGASRRLLSKNSALNNDIVNSIVQDEKGQIWIGTDHGGINVLNKSNFSCYYLQKREEDVKTVAENAIYALYKDNLGIIWCGTYKRGISYYAENMMKFPLYMHKYADPNSLSYNDVNCFAEDRNGNVWIGTNGAGLIYFDRKANTFTRMTHAPGNNNSISAYVILSLFVDDNNSLWIGYYFGGLDNYHNGTFTHYRTDTANNGLSNKTVWKIYKDKQQNFWIGTLGGGLDRFDQSAGLFYHNNVNIPNSVHSNYITDLTEDTKGNLWISTAYGIDVLDKAKGVYVHYLHSTHQLSNDNANSLLCDSRGIMWVGTRDGLNAYDPDKQQFITFRMKDGLPDNNIISILEDNDHHLWASTSNGLSKIAVQHQNNTVTISCHNYDEKDGLQGNAFNINAALKLKSGELLFGGADGFNIFDPAKVKQVRHEPPIVFTSLQLFNRTIAVNEKRNNHVILPAAMPETHEIILRHNENDFSIDFAALDFTNTDKNRYTYAYKLEGFNKEWQTTDGKSRRITYTNINPGSYTLLLKAVSDDNTLQWKGISLRIRILPPFWATPLAYVLYFVLVVAILLLLRKIVLHRAQRRFALQQERREARQLHELDMLKIKLFTNLSHEFKTPVSLILSPLEEVISHEADHTFRHKLYLIRRNAKRLLYLANQLMDFRKMEMQELKLNPANGDVIAFIRDVVYSFTDLAERKQVAFSFYAANETLYTSFDHDKIERILFNLLSNAFKFTTTGGFVKVFTSFTQTNNEQAVLEIRVEDTGIGIPPERHEKIFEQFFHSDSPGGFVNQGSGIGLAITREFVKLCGGSIRVESEVNKGTTFILHLPMEILTAAAGHITAVEEPLLPTSPQTAPSEDPVPAKKEEKQTLLLVEDNDDFRFYLKENMKAHYHIIEATDGASGWQKTLSAHPDLVVSDVNMPGMNGIALCAKIKSDNRTRHIPVILLTARAAEEEQLQGLETGADDYIVKPVRFEIMLSRVRNLLARRAPAKQLVVLPPPDDTTTVLSADEKFMQKVLEIVNKHLADAGFSVEELSRELFMNRVSVYRRIYAITGQPPIEFIRGVRLQRAAHLLTQTEMNVTEVAYEVGFNNPKYFAKYFKMAYQMLPSAYAAAMKKK